jgi:hypothetical protein
VTAHPKATPEHLRDLCDAPHADARKHALAAAATHATLAPATLWVQLVESPYPDVRASVVANATKWRAAAGKDTLVHLWSTALLAVHGGGKEKPRVARAIAERIAAHPDDAAELLPILRVALRSVRPAERAPGLAALARAVRARPALRDAVAAAIPELTIGEQVSA